MPVTPWPELATEFDLGRILAAPHSVPPGASARSRLWRIRTKRGVFLVKALDDRGGLAESISTVQFEEAARMAGVPMPRPCAARSTGLSIAELPWGKGSVLVRVHEWVDGVLPRRITRDVATALGRALAAIHALRWPCGAAHADRWYRADHGHAHWADLATRATQAGLAWGPPMQNLLPLLEDLESLVAARQAETPPLILTHGDLVPENVLIPTHGNLLIVDWDDAAPWNAPEEVVAVLRSWAMTEDRRIDAPTALAFIEGYRSVDGSFDSPVLTVFAGSVSAACNWLELNARRSLEELDPFNRSHAESRALNVVNELRGLPHELRAWNRLLR